MLGLNFDAHTLVRVLLHVVVTVPLAAHLDAPAFAAILVLEAVAAIPFRRWLVLLLSMFHLICYILLTVIFDTLSKVRCQDTVFYNHYQHTHNHLWQNLWLVKLC